ncbi:MAG: YbfB/YjiJ family MFS transporter [Halomonadaceae bacterium]|nr:MAG: YbfB/YjiJ family MFS transporter [Halomonadaceae bacterium]
MTQPTLRPLLYGMAAALLGIGLARFAYTAILPGLIDQGWFTAAGAAWLGAANLFGYTLGALLATRMAVRWGQLRLIRVSAVLVVLSFLLCSWPLGFPVFFLARLVSGVFGAVLMVVVPAAMLRLLPEGNRVWGGAAIFSGVGLGILLSATLVQWLMVAGMTLAWLGLTFLGVLTLWLLLGPWPGREVPAMTRPASSIDSRQPALLLVYGVYACDAIGFIPHTLFWVDYLQRHLALTAQQGALQWGLFGLGALLGPFVMGVLGRRHGWEKVLIGGLLVKALAVGLPVLHSAIWSLSLSSLLVGALIPGMVATVSGRLSELTTATGHVHAWGIATATFACIQGLMAGVFVALYASESYPVDGVFLLAAFALLTGALLAAAPHRGRLVRA